MLNFDLLNYWHVYVDTTKLITEKKKFEHILKEAYYRNNLRIFVQFLKVIISRQDLASFVLKAIS